MNKENLQEMKCSGYLGVDMTVNENMGIEVSHRVGEGAKALGAF